MGTGRRSRRRSGRSRATPRTRLRDGAWWPVHPLDAERRRSRRLPRRLLRGRGHAVGAAISLARGRAARAAPRLRAAGRRRAGELPAAGRSSTVRSPASGSARAGSRSSPGCWRRHRRWRTGSPRSSSPSRTDDTLELMWGSPGLLLIADAMLERTGEERWASAWSAIAERLLRAAGRARPGPLDPAAVRLGRRDPRTRARARRGRRRARAPPGALPPGRGSPRRDRGAVGHRDPRGRARELAARVHGRRSRTGAGSSAPSGATARPASSRRWPRSRATTSSTRCCSRAAS